MVWISRLFDKAGAFGAILAAMGCASCFPALGSLGAALGMGFLAQYEGVFINTLLPVFAAIVFDPPHNAVVNASRFQNVSIFCRSTEAHLPRA